MTIDNQRFLQYTLYGLGAALWYIVWRFLSTLVEFSFQYFNWAPVDVPIVGSVSNLTLLVSAGLAVAAVELVRRHPVTNKFGIECVSELRKVSWPSWKEIRGTTLVVIGVSVVVSIILLIFDKVFDKIVNLIFSLA